MWMDWKYWLIQSWWVIWILEFPGFMMQPRNTWRISRYLFCKFFVCELTGLFWLVWNFVQLSDLPEIDCLLITQSLDDHCHLNTLRPLSIKFPNLKVLATPNARPLLDPLFSNVRIYRSLDFLLILSSIFIFCLIHVWTIETFFMDAQR